MLAKAISGKEFTRLACLCAQLWRCCTSSLALVCATARAVRFVAPKLQLEPRQSGPTPAVGLSFDVPTEFGELSCLMDMLYDS